MLTATGLRAFRGGCRVLQQTLFLRVKTLSEVQFLEESLPLSSITMKAGKFSTSIRQIASMPSSGYFLDFDLLDAILRQSPRPGRRWSQGKTRHDWPHRLAHGARPVAPWPASTMGGAEGLELARHRNPSVLRWSGRRSPRRSPRASSPDRGIIEPGWFLEIVGHRFAAPPAAP